MKKLLYLLLAIQLLMQCGTKNEHLDHTHGQQTYYTCPMDPQVISDRPGQCPICHMELTPVVMRDGQQNSLRLSHEQVKLANIQTQKVYLGYLNNQLVANATVKENQNNVHTITSRLAGRVERLAVKTKDAPIQKGQVLYWLNSETLAATQQAFIDMHQLLQQRPHDALLLETLQGAIQKLEQWGLSSTQIQDLRKRKSPLLPFPILSPKAGIVKSLQIAEGATVMEGDLLMELVSYDNVWVEAEVYAEESAHVRLNQPVEVSLENQAPLTGKVVQLLPQVAASSTVHLVRIVVTPPPSTVLLPGMQVLVGWHEKEAKTLIVPTNAVLRDAHENTVWVKQADASYEPRSVHLGKTTGNYAQVLHGLTEGEEVVTSGAYLLQSEYIFRKGASPMATHTK